MDDNRQQLINTERTRKENQLLIALKKLGYQDLIGWEVITTLSKNNHFNTRFVNKTFGLKAKSIKWIVDNTGNRPIPALAKCGICHSDTMETDGHKFSCNHWHCYECLSQYLQCDSDVLLDQEYYGVLCPTCKVDNNRTLIEIQEINQIAVDSNGVISPKTLDDLNSLIINLSLKGEEIYSCINQGCRGKWTLLDPPNHGNIIVNKFEVRCPVCCFHQCSKCNIPWSIHGNNCNDQPLDRDTAQYLAENCVKCPGRCGQYVQKDNDRHCNVLKCYLDKIYVCGLCGEKLDSSDFNPYDNNHNRANIHFWEGPLSCRRHLFTPRKEWLEIQK